MSYRRETVHYYRYWRWKAAKLYFALNIQITRLGEFTLNTPVDLLDIATYVRLVTVNSEDVATKQDNIIKHRVNTMLV